MTASFFNHIRLATALSFAFALFALLPSHADAQVYSDTQTPMPRVSVPSPVAQVSDSKQSESLFAQRVDVDAAFSPDDITLLADGSITWATLFVSPDAYSMSLCLAGLSLPEGATLTVSDTISSVVKSVWITASATEAITPTILSSAIILRYVGPSTSLPSFSITAANCGFRPIGHGSATGNKATAGAYGSSASCEVAAVCHDGVDLQRRSVCRLILNGLYYGTGTLVNNTAQDNAPLVLTAAHVVGSASLTSCEALFGYEEPVCQNDYDVYCKGTEEISGGTLVAFDASTDMAVIRLSQSPSVVSAPYWAGWSRTTSAQEASVYCIHHPYGDVKKISTASSATPDASYTGDKNAVGGSFASKSHWFIKSWDDGATEGGSSGSALFSSDGLVIGALTGGSATCKSPVRDYFWMISKAWNASSNSHSTLSSALDPQGLDPQSLSGLNLSQSDVPVFTSSNFSVASESLTESDGITSSISKMVQPFTPSSTRTIWAIGLLASDASSSSSSSKGPRLNVGVSSSASTEPTESVSSLLNQFRSSGNVVLALPSAVTVSKGKTAYLHVFQSNFTSSDAVYLLLADATSDYLLQYKNGSFQTVDGKCLAVNFIYTEQTDTSTSDVTTSHLSVTVSDNVATISGEPMRLVAVYDRQGRLVSQVNPEGDDLVSVNMCGMASGVYIIRALTTAGGQSSFKILNY